MILYIILSLICLFQANLKRERLSIKKDLFHLSGPVTCPSSSTAPTSPYEFNYMNFDQHGTYFYIYDGKDVVILDKPTQALSKQIDYTCTITPSTNSIKYNCVGRNIYQEIGEQEPPELIDCAFAQPPLKEICDTPYTFDIVKVIDKFYIKVMEDDGNNMNALVERCYELHPEVPDNYPTLGPFNDRTSPSTSPDGISYHGIYFVMMTIFAFMLI